MTVNKEQPMNDFSIPKQALHIPTASIVFRADLYPRAKPDPRKIQEYSENLEYEYAGDYGMAVKHDGKYIGLISGGEFRCVDEFWLVAFQDHLKSLPKLTAFQKEEEYCEKISNSMMLDGWDIQREVFTPLGRIDILAKKGNNQQIIEVKLRSDTNSASSALGQLLFYSKSYPKAKLIFASPRTPTEKILSVLGFYKVSFLEIK